MRNQHDFYSGLLFVVVGATFAVGASQHELGTASSMGPGYYPRLIGVLAVLLGTIVIVKSFSAKTAGGAEIGPWAWKQLILILSANLVFGILLVGLPSINLPSMGLVIAVSALVFVASIASGQFKVREYVILSTILVVGVYLICIKILNLYVPLWPAMFTD
jgi:hypothetical protein